MVQWTYQEWESVAENWSPPHRAHRFGFFLLWEYRRRRGGDPGSVVGGQRSLTWQLLLLVQHLFLALLGLRSTMSSHITILCLVSGPHDQALSLISARYSLPYHFYRWWTNCFSPVGDSPHNLPQLLPKAHDLQGQSQREMDGCSGCLSFFKDFRFDLIFPITWWHYLIVGGGGGQGEEEHSGHLRGRENPNKAQVGCASALDACLWRWAMDQQMMNYPSLGMSKFTS